MRRVHLRSPPGPVVYPPGPGEVDSQLRIVVLKTDFILEEETSDICKDDRSQI